MEYCAWFVFPWWWDGGGGETLDLDLNKQVHFILSLLLLEPSAIYVLYTWSCIRLENRNALSWTYRILGLTIKVAELLV